MDERTKDERLGRVCLSWSLPVYLEKPFQIARLERICEHVVQ
jgi:hypothetical protein